MTGAFLLIKVMAGKLFFKPYKVTRFFDKEVHQLDRPVQFKENCLAMGYTMIALFTDFLFDIYKVEMERTEGKKLTAAKDILLVKAKMF